MFPRRLPRASVAPSPRAVSTTGKSATASLAVNLQTGAGSGRGGAPRATDRRRNRPAQASFVSPIQQVFREMIMADDHETERTTTDRTTIVETGGGGGGGVLAVVLLIIVV